MISRKTIVKAVGRIVKTDTRMDCKGNYTTLSLSIRDHVTGRDVLLRLDFDTFEDLHAAAAIYRRDVANLIASGTIPLTPYLLTGGYEPKA